MTTKQKFPLSHAAADSPSQSLVPLPDENKLIQKVPQRNCNSVSQSIGLLVSTRTGCTKHQDAQKHLVIVLYEWQVYLFHKKKLTEKIHWTEMKQWSLPQEYKLMEWIFLSLWSHSCLETQNNKELKNEMKIWCQLSFQQNCLILLKEMSFFCRINHG